MLGCLALHTDETELKCLKAHNQSQDKDDSGSSAISISTAGYFVWGAMQDINVVVERIGSIMMPIRIFYFTVSTAVKTDRPWLLLYFRQELLQTVLP